MTINDRPMKYRAWDVLEKRMLPWEEIRNWPLSFGEDNSAYVLIQYTGLHDSRGTEIYEGDIVVFTPRKWVGTGAVILERDGFKIREQLYEDAEPCPATAVEWDDSGAWYPFADADDGMPYAEPSRCEVIGNIYENPELLLR